MKFYKSNTTKDINSLERDKIKLSVKGEDVEGIWVAKDPENKKMYLLNHALAFYPIPSWGTEWDLANTLDVAKARGEEFSDTVLTFHPEAFKHFEEFMLDDNKFDVNKFLDREHTGEVEETESEE